jgi:Protein of unknown function (DUF2950)
LAVIDVCGALADAQAEYFSERHDDGSTKQYALKFIRDTGKQKGLYWESPEGQPKSPLGALGAFATEEGYKVNPDSLVPFGYNLHMLKRQGSHAQGGAKDYGVDGKMSWAWSLPPGILPPIATAGPGWDLRRNGERWSISTFSGSHALRRPSKGRFVGEADHQLQIGTHR